MLFSVVTAPATSHSDAAKVDPQNAGIYRYHHDQSLPSSQSTAANYPLAWVAMRIYKRAIACICGLIWSKQ
jgi:hypothetical protein